MFTCIIEQSINRLLSMQDHSGGLGYWPGGSATVFASAYGGMVLAIAEDRGHDVPDDQLKLTLSRAWPDGKVVNAWVRWRRAD